MSLRDLRHLLGRGRAGSAMDRELREEMDAHIAHRVDELVAEGIDPDEARARAVEAFGDPERIRRECLEARAAEGPATRLPGPAAVLDGLRRDLAYAFRQLRRGPGFAALAILTLTLGIGATTAILAVVRTVVIEPLPFHEPERLVLIEEVTPSGEQFSVSEPTYLDWRDRSRSFVDMGAATSRTSTLQGVGEPMAVRTLVATPSLLPTLGVEPLLGRSFRDEDAGPGEPRAVAILGHAFWRDAFGADPGVLGRDVVLSGEAHRIVGVLPPGRAFVDDADVVVPLAPTLDDRTEHYLDVWGRLAPGATLDGARGEMAAIAAELGALHPEDAGWGTNLVAMRDVLVGDELTRAGWMLLAGAFLLLAIACVNVSNLLLARGTVRRREIGVRVALGAGGGRIFRQLLTESLVLAAIGGAGGLLLGRILVPVVKALGDGRIPRLDAAAIGGVDLVACIAATVLAAVLFGLAPAAELRGPGPVRALRSSRSSGGGGRLRSALVGGQIALSLVLLVTTGLLARSFVRLASVDTGFEAEGTLTMRVGMPGEEYDPDARRVLLQELVDGIAAVPGVTAAGATVIEPFAGNNLMNFVAREDRLPEDARDFQSIAWRIVTPGFEEALGLDLLAGRSFARSDGWEDGTPVIVSRTLARALWPDHAPGEVVGSTLVWGDPGGSRVTVVGVVEDLRDWRLSETPQPMMFRPYAQIPWTVMTLVARVQGGGAAGVAGDMRGVVRRLAPGLPVPEVRSLEQDVDRAVAGPRFNTLLLGAFALAGLLLAGVGVYGVTAFEVARRVPEIGIRLAVGGDPGAIRRLVLADSMRLTALGVLAGIALAWPVGRWVEVLLFGTSARDPAVWSAVVAGLVLSALVATWLPALRATRVEPSEALRAD